MISYTVYFKFKNDEETDERQEAANTAKNQIQQAIPESDIACHNKNSVDDFVENTNSINDDGQYFVNKQETQSRIKTPPTPKVSERYLIYILLYF